MPPNKNTPVLRPMKDRRGCNGMIHLRLHYGEWLYALTGGAVLSAKQPCQMINYFIM